MGLAKVSHVVARTKQGLEGVKIQMVDFIVNVGSNASC
jgi:hypothetical protein